MHISYETFRALEAACENYQQSSGDWLALIDLNQALKHSGLHNEAVLTASKTIDDISEQSVIEEEEWKTLDAAGLCIHRFIEKNLVEMRQSKEKKNPSIGIYEKILWLKDDLNTIKSRPFEEHSTLWKQAMNATKHLESELKIPKEDPILKIALHNIHFIESLKKVNEFSHKHFAPYTTLLVQTHEILNRYLKQLQGQRVKNQVDGSDLKKKAA